MVAVDEILTDSLGAVVREWFEPDFSHRFFGLQTISVPDDVKPIPQRWVNDVEVQIDEGFGAEMEDVLGEGPVTSWTADEGRTRLRAALARLDLAEDQLAHPDLSRMNRADLSGEKRRVKQELKRYDTDFRRQFMRLPSHVEKEPMRPLYVYYRRLKTMITQAEQQKGRRSSQGTLGNSDDEGTISRIGTRDSMGSLEGDGLRRGSSAQDQVAALEARIDSLQNEKGAVRAKLQAFQEKFVHEYNRKIRFHKDILPIEREYRMYKNLKDEIQRAEAQLKDLTRK